MIFYIFHCKVVVARCEVIFCVAVKSKAKNALNDFILFHIVSLSFSICVRVSGTLHISIENTNFSEKTATLFIEAK